jgi:GNAT superfamily N-acetyltransferase
MQDQPIQRHRELIAQGTSWVVADGDGRLVAFLSAELAADALHVWGLYVHPDRQGLGIGRALLDAAVGEATRRGVAAVTLTTFRDLHWNERFYRKLGFKTLAGAELGPRLDEILRREFALGLPEKWRCAMRLELA